MISRGIPLVDRFPLEAENIYFLPLGVSRPFGAKCVAVGFGMNAKIGVAMFFTP